MKRIPAFLTLLCILLTSTLISSSAFAQGGVYNTSAGSSAPMVEREEVYLDEDTKQRKTRRVKVAPKKDNFGNAAGSNYDLAVDGAFEGQTIVVIQLYMFDFEQARAALKEKGFGVYRYKNTVPSPKELEEKLGKACQLWVISGAAQHMTKEHLAVIKKFYDSGKGLYIWGDNTPYHADADFIVSALFDSSMSGDYWGAKVLPMKLDDKATSGLLPDHLLTTGLEHIFEGITIAAIKMAGGLKPLIWSSDGQVVTAYYDQGGKRAIIDGGFTRLYNNWDTAGTGRYVKNAAAWLVNVERFGESVTAKK